jgi:acyl-coenzyme A thioesterase PaaI-like protein
VITALLDTLCGAVVMAAVAEGTPLATLDLRIDYLHPATPEETIRASAECYKVTANVAFVRGLAYHEAIDDPIAHCAGTFMLGTGFSATAAGAAAASAADAGVAAAAGTSGGQPC